MIKNIKTVLKTATTIAALTLLAAVPACTDDDGGATVPGDAQTPPQGSDTEISAWLTAGSYKGAGWKCETAPHDARSPSPHGKNRICSNTKLTQTAAPGKYPLGAASVKELIASDGTTIAGYAIGLKLADGASDGSKWYWYEKMGNSVVFNGEGAAANTDLCSGCHAGAGTDAAHSGRDFVYTQVP